jgi:hypothetical protein
VRLHLSLASEELIALDVSGDPFQYGLTDVVQITPGQLLLSTWDPGGRTALWEVDPLADLPAPNSLFSDTLNYPEHLLDHMAVANVDQFVFVDRGQDDSWEEARPGIYRFTRGETALVPVSTPSMGSGAPMPDPRQLAIDEVDDVWIVNASPPALLRVELLSGLRTEISGASRGAGPLWETATSLVLLDGLPPTPALDPLLKHLLGIESLEGEMFDSVDADRSGVLDAADLVHTVGP